MTNTDPFTTTAARAEAPEPCEHHWVSHGQDSALIPWVIWCSLCGDYDIAEMERVTRSYLAAQEPTDAEVEAAAIQLCAPAHQERVWEALAEVEPARQNRLRADARRALAAARAARRDEEKR